MHEGGPLQGHFIEIVIDKMQVAAADRNRLKSSVALAMQHGKGIIMILDHEKRHPGISAGS